MSEKSSSQQFNFSACGQVEANSQEDALRKLAAHLGALAKGEQGELSDGVFVVTPHE